MAFILIVTINSITLSVIMLNVIMLNVIKLNVVMSEEKLHKHAHNQGILKGEVSL